MSSYQQSIKSQNKKQILQLIIDHAPISRSAIAKQLGMAKGTVSSLSTELIQSEVIYEYGPGSSSGGRRPLMLLFNEKAGYSIGIDVGVNYIMGILTNLRGEKIAEQKQTISVHDFDHMLPLIIKTIQKLIDASPPSPYGIIGVGVGVPGIVNHQGTILFAPNLGWEYVDLQEELENAFDVPVTIENEANAGAYGEKKHNSSSHLSDNLVYVSAGIGIGAGVIINGEIYRGEKGYSGEFGHMMIDMKGRKCSCGSVGCWEMYASEKALLLEAEKVLGSAEGLNLESLIDQAETHPKVTSLFTEVGDCLGSGISSILNGFNPQKVVIGNRLALAEPLLSEPVKSAIDRHTLNFHKEQAEILFSSLTPYSTSLGASHFVTERFIATNF